MTRTLYRLFAAAIAALLICCNLCADADARAAPTAPRPRSPAAATSRIKDIANVEGVRQNQLIGYGLVVGLNNTGDTLNNSRSPGSRCKPCWSGSASTSAAPTLRTGNVAAVMVTANLPAFGTQGSRIDVTVSALGDSKSLNGGTLLVTPLLAADGNVYAVAQGSLAIAGFQAEGDAAKITRGVPTVGRIANGAIIEREVEFALNRLNQVRLSLRNADLTTAKRIAAAINDFIGAPTAEPLDSSTVQINVPQAVRRQRGGAADRDRATADRARSAGQDRDRRALRHHRDGPRRAGVDGRGRAGQPHRDDLRSRRRSASRSRSRAAGPQWCRAPGSACRRTARSSRWCAKASSLQQLIDGLNALGVGPRDLIAILQAIKAAGAIQADIEVM